LNGISPPGTFRIHHLILVAQILERLDLFQSLLLQFGMLVLGLKLIAVDIHLLVLIA
jgi:hypothetical protein